MYTILVWFTGYYIHWIEFGLEMCTNSVVVDTTTGGTLLFIQRHTPELLVASVPGEEPTWARNIEFLLNELKIKTIKGSIPQYCESL